MEVFRIRGDSLEHKHSHILICWQPTMYQDLVTHRSQGQAETACSVQVSSDQKLEDCDALSLTAPIFKVLKQQLKGLRLKITLVFWIFVGTEVLCLRDEEQR